MSLDQNLELSGKTDPGGPRKTEMKELACVLASRTEGKRKPAKQIREQRGETGEGPSQSCQPIKAVTLGWAGVGVIRGSVNLPLVLARIS